MGFNLKEAVKSLGPGKIINGSNVTVDIIVDHKIGPLAPNHTTKGIDADAVVLSYSLGTHVMVRKYYWTSGGWTSEAKKIPSQSGLCVKISNFSTAIIYRGQGGGLEILNTMDNIFTEDWSLQLINKVAQKHRPIPRMTKFNTRALNGQERGLVAQAKSGTY